MKIIIYEEKEMIPLTTKESESYHEKKVCHIYKKISNYYKKYYKVRDHCHFTGKYKGATHYICNLKYKIPKEIPVIFHNGSTYGYGFIIKEPAEEFEGQFKCLGADTGRYITFLVPIKNDKGKKYKINFIDLALGLCQAYYQVLLIIFLIDFIVIIAKIVNPILTIR